MGGERYQKSAEKGTKTTTPMSLLGFYTPSHPPQKSGGEKGTYEEKKKGNLARLSGGWSGEEAKANQTKFFSSSLHISGFLLWCELLRH